MAEEGDAEKLTDFHDGTNEEDGERPRQRCTKTGNVSEAEAEEQDEREREEQVDQIAGDEGTKRAAISGSGDQMQRRHREADDDDDALAGEAW